MKRRRWVSSFLALTLVGWCQGEAMVNVSAATLTVPFARPRLVALGASVTFGTHLNAFKGHPSHWAFPFLIGEDFGMTVTDLGVPGWTSQQLLDALDKNPGDMRTVSKANLVTLQIGGDDIYLLFDTIKDIEASKSKIKSYEVKQVEAIFGAAYQHNLDSIVKRIRTLAPSANIVLYTQYDPLWTKSPNAERAQIYGMFNADVAAVGQKYSLPVADAYRAFEGKQRVLVRSHDIHPTIAGQQVLAVIGERALSALKRR